MYNKDYSVEDYIRLSGGFGWRAIEGDVRVIKSNTGEWIDDEDIESIDPGDTIWIPEDPPGPKFWDIFMDSLTINCSISHSTCSNCCNNSSNEINNELSRYT